MHSIKRQIRDTYDLRCQSIQCLFQSKTCGFACFGYIRCQLILCRKKKKHFVLCHVSVALDRLSHEFSTILHTFYNANCLLAMECVYVSAKMVPFYLFVVCSDVFDIRSKISFRLKPKFRLKNRFESQ